MKTLELLEIKTKKANDERIYNCFTNLTLEQFKVKNNWISDREIVSSEKRVIEMQDDKYGFDYIDERDGMLKTVDRQGNPNDDEMMKITNSDMAEAEENETMEDFYKSIGE